MRGRLLAGRKHSFGAGGLLLVSLLFLLVSVVSSFGTIRQSSAAPVADSIGSHIGVAQAMALAAESDNSTIASVPPEALVDSTLSKSLTNQLTAWTRRQPSNQQWAVVVRSLDDNSLNASVQPAKSFESASIFKLYLVYGLTKLVPYSQWQSTKIDSSHSYADCVNAMMIRSDNACAIAIGNKLGWEKVSALLPTAGYKNTILKRDPMSTTPADTALLLSNLYHRTGFNDDAATFILNGMSHSTFKKGIVAGCPDCQVANKTGDLNGFLHDAGILTIGGKHYEVIIFSQGGSQSQIADVTRLVHDAII